MEKLYKKINWIIDYVIRKELISGKTLEDAKRKYTHGFCVSLATLIKSQFIDNESVRMFEFGRTYRKIEPDGYYKWKGQIWHMCVVVGDVDEFDRPLPSAIVFDINGGRPFIEMPAYLSEQYPNPFDSNYSEDMVNAVDYKKYVIEDSVKSAEMRKYEIFREEEGFIEECYYEFLQAKQKIGDDGSVPFFALFDKQLQTEDGGEFE